MKIDTILSSENLGTEFSEDELNEIATELLDGVESDERSRKGWRDSQDDAVRLAMQVVEGKTFPWKGAANVKYPLLSTAALQFASRAYPALVPGVNLVRGKVNGYDTDGMKMAKADRIGKHMSYQLIEQMQDWEEDMDKLCMSLPILGTMFKKTYYDSVKQQNVSELVYPQDLIVNYWAKSLEDAQRVTQLIQMSDNEIYEKVVSNIFLDWGDELYKAVPVESVNDVADEVHKINQPETVDKSTPHEIAEIHCYLDLDNDGYSEPYVVTIHLESEKILRIVARFDQDGLYMDGKKVLRIEPINYYTKFSFVPDPTGAFYDLGFGLLLGPINETINTTINQLLDAGTLSNMQAGFISKGIRLKGGEKSFEPGEWKWVNTTGDDLRKGIIPLPVREPSNVLFTLLNLMIESGEKMASVTDMLMGQNPGQNQPATTSMNVLEQGLKVFTSIYKRMYRSLKKEYRKLFLLNSKYLPEMEYFNILDLGKEQQSVAFKADYDLKSADVVPYADPNVASESLKMLKAQALTELLQLGTLDPMEVTKRLLDAQNQPMPEALLAKSKGPSFEEIKLQEEMKLEYAKLEILKETNEIKKTLADTQAILNIAKAEAEEIGQQFEQYRAQLETVKTIHEIKEKQMEMKNGEETGNSSGRSSGMAAQQGNGGTPVSS